MRITIVIASLLLTSTLTSFHSRNLSLDTKRAPVQEKLDARSAGVRIELAQQMSNRCLTPYFWCVLPVYAPVGTACWCASPNGPVAGRVG